MRRVVFGGLALGVGAMMWFAHAQQHDRILPDPTLTPGSVVDVDLSVMCEVGYSARRRVYDKSRRNKIFHSYGLNNVDRSEFELDHLVPLALAGQDSVDNMWPESRVTEPWNAEVKDTLEDVLHREVCAGRVPLKEAQDAVRENWVVAYKHYVGEVPRRFAVHER